MWWRSVLWTGVIFATLSWLVPSLLWLACRLAGKAFSYRLPYAPFGWTALALAIIVCAGIVYGHYIGRFAIEVNEIEYAGTDVPAAFDGYKIVHISQLCDKFIKDPNEVVRLNQKVRVMVSDVDVSRNRISLTMRNIASQN